MSDNIIVYPIALSYVPDWGPWACIRELCTNAMDADSGFKMGLTPATDDAGPRLWVESRGNLVERHLLLGISEKSEGAIGQHGEGLKLAMLVLTRMGLTAHIHTDSGHFWNEPARLSDTDVFAICSCPVDEGPNYKPGFTHIVIPDWPHRLYRDRFITEGDSRVVYCDPFGRFVLDEEIPQLYVKGVWISKASGYGKHYRFGYNLTDVKMNRDRATVSQWDVNWEIGKIWASCSDEELLVRFWRSVRDQGAERDCRLANHELMKGPHKRAFQTVFGKRAVVGTDEAVSREATHIGAKIVTSLDVGPGVVEVVKELVGTDADHIRGLHGANKVFVPDKKLGDVELKVLKLLRRLARRVGFQGKILAYILPDRVLGEQHKSDVRVSLTRLSDDETAVATWLHEEAHRQHGAADSTDKMVSSVAAVAAKIIVSYARR